jgi:hypothetical protein
VNLETVLRTYQGSDGEATKALYARLDEFGPAGVVALNLLRAQKASERAKLYRGGVRGKGSYRGMAYERKQWAMDNLCAVLGQHGAALDIAWGWGLDAKAVGYEHVLYVELPTGQASFHTACRGQGPDHGKDWDGIKGQSADRIIRWAARLLDARDAHPVALPGQLDLFVFPAASVAGGGSGAQTPETARQHLA